MIVVVAVLEGIILAMRIRILVGEVFMIVLLIVVIVEVDVVKVVVSLVE